MSFRDTLRYARLASALIGTVFLATVVGGALGRLAGALTSPGAIMEVALLGLVFAAATNALCQIGLFALNAHRKETDHGGA